MGLPQWLRSKESPCNAGDMDLIPGSGRSPGEENCNPPQCSCLGNPMDGGNWRAAESQRVRHTFATKQQQA